MSDEKNRNQGTERLPVACMQCSAMEACREFVTKGVVDNWHKTGSEEMYVLFLYVRLLLLHVDELHHKCSTEVFLRVQTDLEACKGKGKRLRAE